jgi:hypothetical protein
MLKDVGLWLCKHVFLDLLCETDTFDTLLRKLLMSCSLGFFVHPLAYFAYNIYTGTEQGFTPGIVGFIGACFCFMVVFGGSYGYAHATGKMPDGLIDFWTLGTMCGMSFVTTCSTYPTLMPILAFLQMGAMCRPRLLALALVWGACNCVLAVWNTSVISANDASYAPWHVPGTHIDNLVEHLMNNLSNFLFIVVIMAAVILQASIIQKMLADAHASAALAKNVAEHLRKYDTDAVDAELAAYCDTTATPDPQLLETYAALVSNLNKYRPHIPNWLVHAESDEEAAAEEESVLLSGRGSRMTPSQPGSTARVSRSNSNTSVAQSPIAPSPTPSVAGIANSRSRRFSPGSSMNGSHTSLLATGGVMLLSELKTPRIAFAQVDFRATGEARHMAISRFVECAHQLAAATHCALHTFVGDTVQLSWNAATRAAQPEVKAVRFLIRLAAAVMTIDDIVATGAAMSGNATTQIAGTERVKALAVSIPWRRVLTGLATFARRNSTFVVDEATAAEANATCELQSVELLRFDDRINVGNNRSCDIVVKEVLKERDNDNDEWMYVLEETSVVDPVTAALNMCVAGHYGDAVAALEKIAASQPLTAPTLKHLRTRAVAALRSSPSHFALPVCACDV